MGNISRQIRNIFANIALPMHSIHSMVFLLMSCGHLAEEHTSAIYIVGAREPGIARGMGLKTRATVEEALADAMKKYVGGNPNILALPKAFINDCCSSVYERSITEQPHERRTWASLLWIETIFIYRSKEIDSQESLWNEREGIK